MVAEIARGGDAWNLLSLLQNLVGGGSCFCQVQKRRTSQSSLNFPSHPVIRVRDGGDCGPDAAAWLLNEHGPTQSWSRAPETRTSVREKLREAWKTILDNDASGDEHQAFVQQRLEQVLEAVAEASPADDQDHEAAQERLRQSAALILEALLRDEPILSTTGDDSDGAGSFKTVLPYWFLPSDWARLSEVYQVDFVLHGLPGMEDQTCDHCGCTGHVHFGPKAPGAGVSLHVGWRSSSSSSSSSSGSAEVPASPQPAPGSERSGGSLSIGNKAWGHWEPLGAGPILPKGAAASTPRTSERSGNGQQDPYIGAVQVYGSAPQQFDHDGSLACCDEDGSEAPAVALKLWTTFGCQRACPPQWSCQDGATCSCPRRNCQGLCQQCDKVRRGSSDDDPALIGGGLPLSSYDAPSVLTVTSAVPACGSNASAEVTPRPSGAATTSSPSTPPRNSGARYCVFIQGATPLTFASASNVCNNGCEGGTGGTEGGTGGTSGRSRAKAGPDASSDARSIASGSSGSLKDGSSTRATAAGQGEAPDVDLSLQRFREAFAKGLAAAVGVAPGRVRVVEVGQPFNMERRSQARAATSMLESSEVAANSAAQAVDTGAGVLSFLDEDEEAGVSVLPPETANDSGAASAMLSSLHSSTSASARGVARVLFVIREAQPSPTQASDASGEEGDKATERLADEPTAIKAVEKVSDVLKRPDSALHMALQPWIDECGGSARLWCPEAAAERGAKPSSWLARRQPSTPSSPSVQDLKQVKLPGSNGGA